MIARVHHLDGWRVVAIGLVLCDHLSNNSRIAALYHDYGLPFIADYGEVGVFIFFFISGHVISRSSLAEIRRTGAFSIPAFYVRRFFRIVPPFILYLGCCLSLGSFGIIDFTPANAVSAAFYLCNSTAPLVACNWYVGHTWSLAFEEQFYLIYPIAFAWFELRKGPPVIGSAIAVSIAVLPLAFPIWWIGKTVFFTAYTLFFAGYLTAKHEQWLSAATAKFGNSTLLFFCIAVFLPRSVIASFGETEAAKANLIDLYHAVYAIAVPCLVLLSGRDGSFLLAPLTRQPIVTLGRATYSIYLWQQLLTGRPFSDLDVALQLTLLAALLPLCTVLHFQWELRLIEYGRYRANRVQIARQVRAEAT